MQRKMSTSYGCFHSVSATVCGFRNFFLYAKPVQETVERAPMLTPSLLQPCFNHVGRGVSQSNAGGVGAD